VIEEIEIWTDGGSHGNPGPGGWAFVMRSAAGMEERVGFEENTTNNRMELTAVREALVRLTTKPRSAGAPVTLHTDSQYVQKGITQWIHTWARNGWKTSGKKPVKNSELWLALWELSRDLPIRWVWVMGHAGNEMNELCDQLVQEAIARSLKHPT
jgi:ribonuclease HI